MKNQSIISWLVPTLVSGIVGMAAIGFTYKISSESLKNQKQVFVTQKETNRLKHQFEKSNIMLAVISAANGLEREKLDALLNYVLRPLVKEKEFIKIVNDLSPILAKAAASAPIPAKELPISDILVNKNATPPTTNNNYRKLVSEFTTDQRLVNSNKLLAEYPKNKKKIVEALVSGLLPETDRWSYRVNIYIALTLARVSNGWIGSPQELSKIDALKMSKHYKNDSTFRRRVDEAIDNFLAQ